MQHWNADTSVPVAVWSKGEDGEYLRKARYQWGLCRQKISKSKWDVLSVENMKDLKSRTATKQRREGNTFIASLSTVCKV